MTLAAFFTQADPQPPALAVDVLDLHCERGADAGEAVDHQANQRPVAQTHQGGSVDAVEQCARFGWLQHRRLALAHDMPGSPHRRGRIHGHDLTHHQPVKQMADGGEPLLHGGRGSFAAKLFDVGRDVQRQHAVDRRDAAALAPCQEFPRRLRVGAARVDVADVGGEEFEEADLRALAGGVDQDGHGRRRDKSKLVQCFFAFGIFGRAS